MRTLVAGFALCGCACGGFSYRTDMPRPPVCVKGGAAPVSMSMSDYGTSYTPDMTGTLETTPDSYLVPEAQAGEDCVPRPWWSPPESSYH
jgi:hypothetical protein